MDALLLCQCDSVLLLYVSPLYHCLMHTPWVSICGSYYCFVAPVGVGVGHAFLQIVSFSRHDCLLSDSVLGDLLHCKAV